MNATELLEQIRIAQGHLSEIVDPLERLLDFADTENLSISQRAYLTEIGEAVHEALLKARVNLEGRWVVKVKGGETCNR